MILGNKYKMEAYLTSQGDCLIKKIGTKGVFETEYAKIPEEAVEVKDSLVLKGMSNSHALFGGAFKVFDYEGVKFIKVVETTVLDHVKDMQTKAHAEHHAQYIPPGEYFVDAIMEYDHVKKESRRVID